MNNQPRNRTQHSTKSKRTTTGRGYKPRRNEEGEERNGLGLFFSSLSSFLRGLYQTFLSGFSLRIAAMGLICLPALALFIGHRSSLSAPERVVRERVNEAYGRIPLSFEA